MTKGEAYRAYYAANAERIRAANRERAKAYREKLKAEGGGAERTREREAYGARKARVAKAAFLAKSKDAEEALRPFYRLLASRPDLDVLSPRLLRWLCEIKTPASV